MTTEKTNAIQAPACPKSWEMAASILIALRKAAGQAEDEWRSAMCGANQNPFGPGVTLAANTQQALREAERCLSPELHSLARLNGLPMPCQ